MHRTSHPCPSTTQRAIEDGHRFAAAAAAADAVVVVVVAVFVVVGTLTPKIGSDVESHLKRTKKSYPRSHRVLKVAHFVGRGSLWSHPVLK